MKKLQFEININAHAAKVWQVLWSNSTYGKWTLPFCEGSYAVSDWKEGSSIQFLNPGGNGMNSIIETCRPKEYMAFKHIAEVKNFAEQPVDPTSEWGGSMETYSLKEENGITTLTATVDAVEPFLDFFNTAFPKSMNILKELSEQPILITVETTVAAPIEKVWEYWTKPEHITQWNNASPDWHTPRAENDVQVGGKFHTRMEAKDGSFGFDFEGIYTAVEMNKKLAYTLLDDRTVTIDFSQEGDTIKIVEIFGAEEENSLELQQAGWQAILDNFKKHVETN